MSQLSQTVSGKGNTKPSLKTRIRARRWLYTLNNYTELEMSQMDKLFSVEKFWVQGKEISKSGTPHLQGYVEFKDQKDFSCITKINPRISWRKADGDRNANVKYCTKEGDSKIVEKKPMSEQEIAEFVMLENRRERESNGFSDAYLDYLKSDRSGSMNNGIHYPNILMDCKYDG